MGHTPARAGPQDLYSLPVVSLSSPVPTPLSAPQLQELSSYFTPQEAQLRNHKPMCTCGPLPEAEQDFPTKLPGRKGVVGLGFGEQCRGRSVRWEPLQRKIIIRSDPGGAGAGGKKMCVCACACARTKHAW